MTAGKRGDFTFIWICNQDVTATLIGIPHWCTVLVMLPALWLGSFAVRRRRQRRLAKQLCPSCGYDLRASPG